jgi:hypothetical protein
MEQNQAVNHRFAPITLSLIILCAVASDGTRTRKSAGKRLTCPSYKSAEPAPKRGLICGRIDSFGDKLRQLRPARPFRTARANNFRDDTNRLAIEAKAAPRRIDYANKNPDADDFKGAADDSEKPTDDSQDDADEPEDTTDES